MGTRSTIKIFDSDNTFYIYRHYDGYPEGESGVIATLKLAQPYSWPLPRFEAMDFAASIVRAWKTGAGNIYLTEDHKAHWDTAYQYDVTCKSGAIWVHVWETCEKDKRRTLFKGRLEEAMQHFDETSE